MPRSCRTLCPAFFVPAGTLSGFFVPAGTLTLAAFIDAALVGATAPRSVEVRMSNLLIEILKGGGVGVVVLALVFAPAVYVTLFGRSDRPMRRLRSLVKEFRSPKRR